MTVQTNEGDVKHQRGKLMTVQELIKLLKRCDPNAEVIFSDLEKLTSKNIRSIENCLTSGEVYLYQEKHFEIETTDYLDVKIVNQFDGFVSTRYYDADGEMTYFKLKETNNDTTNE